MVAVAVLSATSAGAQPADITAIEQAEILPQPNVQNIEPALKTFTGNHLVTIGAEKREYIIAAATNGLRFEVYCHPSAIERQIGVMARCILQHH